jgi:hypothetical protein
MREAGAGMSGPHRRLTDSSNQIIRGIENQELRADLGLAEDRLLNACASPVSKPAFRRGRLDYRRCATGPLSNCAESEASGKHNGGSVRPVFFLYFSGKQALQSRFQSD